MTPSPRFSASFLEAVGFDSEWDRHGVVISLRRLNPGDLDNLFFIEMARQDGESRVGDPLGGCFFYVGERRLLPVGKGGTFPVASKVSEFSMPSRF